MSDLCDTLGHNFGWRGICERCGWSSIELLRAENNLLRAELATVKVNYETYVNDVRTAEQAEIASLRAHLAAVHGLLREASDGRVLDWVDWIERAKKEVGDG